MATQTGVITYDGKLDKTIGYNRKGKRCVRRLPEQVRRSDATILSGTDFGTASKAGKLVRMALVPALDIRMDYTLTNRLNKEMLKVLYTGSRERGNRRIQNKALELLKGFQFNKATGLDRLLPFPTPQVVQDGDKLRIVIPAMEAYAIRHAGNTTHIEIKAVAAGLRFNGNDNQEQAVSDKVLFRINEPVAATELVLPFKAGEAETIVVLQVRAFHEHNGKLLSLGNVKYFAADIIDVIPSFTEEEAGTPPHAAELSLQQSDKTYTAPKRE
ncbi:hypothetical protein [Chitinophaga niabensis]|uniref:Uncharacterized protein n=1 Tax=Chitinophaga niabensis TaxID=536979 RepID=A0A1N6EDP4_9BACT|nr:hypothetical protein [Chitinophaga niabensis]SIN81175.1 hypothetical protein SAMN04488055_1517 [Chitinophaga niabensis]